jgi:hypothetical protein
MRPWQDTPPEVANLLNPAFCGQILFRAVKAHMKESNMPMPYPLAFLVLPLVLHGRTRQSIKATTKHLQVWLNGNQPIKVGLSARARSLVPYTRQALAFVNQTGAVNLALPEATLIAADRLRTVRNRKFPQSDETKECISKAEVLGKWFARANSTTTVYASLGLMP